MNLLSYKTKLEVIKEIENIHRFNAPVSIKVETKSQVFICDPIKKLPPQINGKAVRILFSDYIIYPTTLFQ